MCHRGVHIKWRHQLVSISTHVGRRARVCPQPRLGQRNVEWWAEMLKRTCPGAIVQWSVVDAVVGEEDEREAMSVESFQALQMVCKVRVQGCRSDTAGLVALQEHRPREARQAQGGVGLVEALVVLEEGHVGAAVAEAALDWPEVELVSVVGGGAPRGDEAVVRGWVLCVEWVNLLHDAPVAHVGGEGGGVAHFLVAREDPPVTGGRARRPARR
mmetsp:Transcript_39/g.133  ORF Transcript_39/g.133 Transcript_39/m.133 type:complete len:214 (+) Transcript_39:318-959(+)